MGSMFYRWLVDAEDGLLRMIEGVFRFIGEGLWVWIRHFLFDTLWPLAVRMARVSALACLLLLIVFTPAAVGIRFHLPSWLGFGCVAWSGLSICGSIWGLRRVVRKRKAEARRPGERR